jgi:hypothetical protein
METLGLNLGRVFAWIINPRPDGTLELLFVGTKGDGARELVYFYMSPGDSRRFIEEIKNKVPPRLLEHDSN